jgi:hypothetical protein
VKCASPTNHAFDYQRQVELIMNAPLRDERRAGSRNERFAAAAVLLAIAVSVCGAGIVIVESSAEPPHKSAGVASHEIQAVNPQTHATENNHAR